jgi:hypothetical protein
MQYAVCNMQYAIQKVMPSNVFGWFLDKARSKRQCLIVLEAERMPVDVHVHVKFQAPLASPVLNKGKRPLLSLFVSNHVPQRSRFQLSMS